MIKLDKTNDEGRLYAAYGANTNFEKMKARCGDNAVYLCNITLENYELTLSGYGHCNVAPKRGAETICALWRISPKAEAALDRYEGYPDYYDKKIVDMNIDEKTANVLVYIMQESLAQYPAIPDDFYVDTVRQGYISCGIPEQQLDCALENAKKGFYTPEVIDEINDAIGQLNYAAPQNG
jgi:gamma-glutamylcyclotransferase (GGCT)/AIG2-like uncharacterized protein YtfP